MLRSLKNNNVDFSLDYDCGKGTWSSIYHFKNENFGKKAGHLFN